MLNVLVTGGAGFIGSHLVRALLGRGYPVRVLDNFTTGCLDNLEEVLTRIELIDGDVRKRDTVRAAVKGVEIIFHLAALPSVQRSMKDPVSTAQVNEMGTLNVLDAALHARARRVVFASSSSIYGDGAEEMRRETMPARPLSPYALSKWVGEQYASLYARVFGLETVALRYFNVFGPRQDPSSQYSAVIPRFIAAFSAGDQPVIYGNGDQFRDFTYVENVVQANLLAATVPGISGHVFNVGCGQTLTLNALHRRLADLLRVCDPPRYQPARNGEVRFSKADITLARDVLGYAPNVNVQEGLRRTVEWFLSSQEGRKADAVETSSRALPL